MPRVNLDKSPNVPVYGQSEYKNVSLFREKLLELFQPQLFVRVINIDDERFVWQYMPAENEHESYDGEMHRIIDRDPVEVWELEPGESDVLLGQNAYVMIEGLYKKFKAKAIIEKKPDMKPGQARAFAFFDDLSQVDFIKKVYQGVVKPSFSGIDSSERVLEDKLPKGGATYEPDRSKIAAAK